MKKGFTMIELIFVIVILGILASVAIPRLAGTRADAEISAAIGNMRTMMSDIASYYVTTGSFSKDITVMTNVPMKEGSVQQGTGDLNDVPAESAAQGPSGYLNVAGGNCLRFETWSAYKGDSNDNCPAVLQFYIAENPTGVCKQIADSQAVKDIIEKKVACARKKDASQGGGYVEITGVAIGSGSSIY